MGVKGSKVTVEAAVGVTVRVGLKQQPAQITLGFSILVVWWCSEKTKRRR